MKKEASKTHIQISKQKRKIKVSGSINLGYIGNFKKFANRNQRHPRHQGATCLHTTLRP